MRSVTPPPGASFHFPPISLMIWCHDEPSGAEVPILIRISGAAAAGVAAPAAAARTTTRDPHARNRSLIRSLPARGDPCPRPAAHSFDKELIGPPEKPARPALHDQVRQPPFRPRVHVDPERPPQQRLEFGPDGMAAVEPD